MIPAPVALIIDDEIQMRRLLRLALESKGYKVFDADCGQAGLAEAAFHRPDVVLLDLGLPDIDGLAVLRRLREWSQVPVLVLSVLDQESVKVAALENGADDYVTKPFSTAELIARLAAIQRRQSPSLDPVCVLGPLHLDFSNREVTLDGQPVRLTPTEYALLKMLAHHAGKIVTQRQLLREVWGPHAVDQTHYLRVYVNHLRKKIETESRGAPTIRNEPGIGYRMVVGEHPIEKPATDRPVR